MCVQVICIRVFYEGKTSDNMVITIRKNTRNLKYEMNFSIHNKTLQGRNNEFWGARLSSIHLNES